MTAVTSAVVAGVAGSTATSALESSKRSAIVQEEVTKFLAQKGARIEDAVSYVTTKATEVSKHAEKAESAAVRAEKSETVTEVMYQQAVRVRDDSKELVAQCKQHLTSSDITHKKRTEELLLDIQSRLEYAKQIPEAHASLPKGDVVMRSMYEHFGVSVVEDCNVVLFTASIVLLLGFGLGIGLILLITSASGAESSSADRLRKLSKIILIEFLKSSIIGFIIGWGASVLWPIVSAETGAGNIASIFISTFILSVVSLLIFIILKKCFTDEK